MTTRFAATNHLLRAVHVEQQRDWHKDMAWLPPDVLVPTPVTHGLLIHPYHGLCHLGVFVLQSEVFARFHTDML